MGHPSAMGHLPTNHGPPDAHDHGYADGRNDAHEDQGHQCGQDDGNVDSACDGAPPPLPACHLYCCENLVFASVDLNVWLDHLSWALGALFVFPCTGSCGWISLLPCPLLGPYFSLSCCLLGLLLPCRCSTLEQTLGTRLFPCFSDPWSLCPCLSSLDTLAQLGRGT